MLRGPRQFGKISFLESLKTHTVVYLDVAATRSQAIENPRFFLDNLPPHLLLDVAPLAPQLFPELKRRVDEQRRNREKAPQIDYWITSSNQTLLRKDVRESLAGRASYFDLNTLSIHELGERWNLPRFLISGGWPELWGAGEISPVRYINDLISTFIEKDIVSAAGIERKQAFTKVLQLCAGRIGQLLNASDIARTAGVDVTTVQSWISILEDNGILRSLSGYYTNTNTRLTKASKLYLEDVGLATRLQGWTDVQPLTVSPVIGNLLENIAVNEVSRFFVNRGELPNLNYLRSKEQVEIDLIIHLPNQRVIAAEVKKKHHDFSKEQLSLLESTGLNIIERWTISPTPGPAMVHSRVVTLREISESLTIALGA